MSDLMGILVARIGLPRDAVTDDPAETFEGIGLDSLARIQLNAQLEEQYGVEVDDERPYETFGELLALVNEELSEHAG
ncbi:acyl carrier protein [Actinoplanes sp. NPDC026619]|uniref:acyl carrier protein n=1 Tax=Actinoplanes sp. NPDC026619 TaxID=3155798 RepID=UPI0033D52BEC